LQDGTYTWRARATDTAGNASPWSDARALTIDTTPPVVTLLAPPARTSGAPQLQVELATPGDSTDSARALVQLCSDPACSDVIASGWTGNGTLVTWAGPVLADGTYWWRALGEDVAGNQSLWSLGSPFVVDTAAPAAPSLSAVPLTRASLTATIPAGDPNDGGRVEFEICADTACADVILTGSAVAAADGSATWTPTLGDGAYTWRARSVDLAGNASEWSAPAPLTVDRTPPGAPQAVHATVSRSTLTLRWKAPKSKHAIARYLLFINGRPAQSFGPATRMVKIKLKPHDRRTFSVAAVDTAGNVGAAASLYAPQGISVKRAAQR
jgi:hypothetical protein